MKKLHLLTLIAVTFIWTNSNAVALIPTTSAVIAKHDSNTQGSELANPERRRVAGSAMVLKTNKTITDDTIPEIESIAEEIPVHTIVDGDISSDVPLPKIPVDEFLIK